MKEIKPEEIKVGDVAIVVDWDSVGAGTVCRVHSMYNENRYSSYCNVIPASGPKRGELASGVFKSRFKFYDGESYATETEKELEEMFG